MRCDAAVTVCADAPDHPTHGVADHRPGPTAHRSGQTGPSPLDADPAHRDRSCPTSQRPSRSASRLATGTLAPGPGRCRPGDPAAARVRRRPGEPDADADPDGRDRRRRRHPHGPAGRRGPGPDPDPDAHPDGRADSDADGRADPDAHPDADPRPDRDPAPVAAPERHQVGAALPLQLRPSGSSATYWCVPAATQTMMNIILRQQNRSWSRQNALYRQIRANNRYTYATSGNDVAGWAWALRHWTHQPYRREVVHVADRPRSTPSSRPSTAPATPSA